MDQQQTRALTTELTALVVTMRMGIAGAQAMDQGGAARPVRTSADIPAVAAELRCRRGPRLAQASARGVFAASFVAPSFNVPGRRSLG